MEKHATRSQASAWAQGRFILQATRPRQWAKNLLVFLAFFFTIGDHGADGFAGEISLLGRVALAFALFSSITGATYIINDLADAERDRQHPRKRLRPIASGRLTPAAAATAAAGLSASSLIFAFRMDLDFGLVCLLYLVLNVAYSISIKRLIILDVMSISAGFALRAVAGALIINVPISPWLYVMTSLGALMIALGKRRSELAALGAESGVTRAVLGQYTVQFVDQLITVVAPATVVSYILYTFTAENLPRNHAMMLTIPFVVYGIFRYLFLIHNGNLAEAPEDILLTDVPLMINNALWLATASSILLLFH